MEELWKYDEPSWPADFVEELNESISDCARHFNVGQEEKIELECAFERPFGRLFLLRFTTRRWSDRPVTGGPYWPRGFSTAVQESLDECINRFDIDEDRMLQLKCALQQVFRKPS